MITKTISGHYDTVFSLEHNNRVFVPSNVDVNRIPWNYNCVMAGQLVPLDVETVVSSSEFWQRYKKLCDIYWEDRSALKEQAYAEYKKQLESMRRYRRAWRLLTDDGLTSFITLLLLPLLIPCQIYMDYRLEKAKAEYENMKEVLWIRDMEFKSAKLSAREAIAAQDRHAGTQYLQLMDEIVREIARQANDHLAFATTNPIQKSESVRFATLEEIYDRLYEPSFREFQSKQRPCRRYHGTYLQSIREGRSQESRNKQQSKNSKSRKTAEAIEIVFGIGDMDNTGYNHAFKDAKQAEILLKDFCDHLLENPHLCFVTTKELENPDWTPPFRNGLIVLNLNVHCDEASPGVHLTCIPYSRGCKRGPDVQAALGRAMTGMGYPSTWTDVLDKNGQRIPKESRTGEVVYNEDGSIRYQQRTDKQGIIDWIESQKEWIEKEMVRRYEWTREYKGSHPRGNLSTPDYKAARAKERKELMEKATHEELAGYIKSVRDYSAVLHSDVIDMYHETDDYEKLLFYLRYCSDEDYQRIMKEVDVFWDQFATRQQTKALESLKEKVMKAEKNTLKQGEISKQRCLKEKQH